MYKKLFCLLPHFLPTLPLAQDALWWKEKKNPGDGGSCAALDRTAQLPL